MRQAIEEGFILDVLANYTTYDHYGSAHPGGINMVFCDGSVRVIDYDIDLATFSAGGDRKGN